MPQSAKARRAYKKKYYQNNAEKFRSKQRDNLEDKRVKSTSHARSKAQNKVDKKRQSSRAYSKLRYSQDPQTKEEASHKYYVSNKESVCSYKRDKYALSEPKPAAKDAYMKDLHSHMLGNTKAKAHLITAYKKTTAFN